MIYTNSHTPLLRDSPPGAIALGTAARADVLSGGGSRASRAPNVRSVRGNAPCVISEREGLRKTISFSSAKDFAARSRESNRGFSRCHSIALTTTLRRNRVEDDSQNSGTYMPNCFNAVRDRRAALHGQVLCAVPSAHPCATLNSRRAGPLRRHFHAVCFWHCFFCFCF